MNTSSLNKRRRLQPDKLHKKKFSSIVLAVLLILFTSVTGKAQNIDITGRITNETNQPVPQASIVVKGTTKGVSADDKGDFKITAPGNGTLVISSVGYTDQEVDIKNRTSIAVTLSNQASTMNEVVVIGYGNQRKEAVTGSVASISGEKLREVPSANVTDALQGRLPGVEMAQTSTQPGAAMQIRIRGTRSLTASNDPLIVLDGIPFAGSINDIDPNNVKSIDILKDASATAIYGSRGANGVILVTTIKGIKGQKARISYNGYFGVKKAFAKYPMMNGPEFIALRKAAGKFTNGVDESDSVNTDWQ